MQCPLCGSLLDANADRRFCEGCGGDLRPPRPLTTDMEPKENKLQMPQKPSQIEGEREIETLLDSLPNKKEPKHKSTTLIAKVNFDQLGVDTPDEKIDDVKVIIGSVAAEIKKRRELKAFVKKVFL